MSLANVCQGEMRTLLVAVVLQRIHVPNEMGAGWVWPGYRASWSNLRPAGCTQPRTALIAAQHKRVNFFKT